MPACTGVQGVRSTTVFADIAAAAESGWDFSSRWIVESQVAAEALTASNLTKSPKTPIHLRVTNPAVTQHPEALAGRGPPLTPLTPSLCDALVRHRVATTA